MDISKLESGENDKINVFLKCVKGSKDVYEYDQDAEIFVLKKSLSVSFPANYGIVPNTHHVDGEPMEVLVLSERAFEQGAVVQVRAIGIIRMKGEVPDDVLIAIPLEDSKHESVKDIKQLNKEVLDNVEEFLKEFKGRKIENIFGLERARRAVERSIELYRRKAE